VTDLRRRERGCAVYTPLTLRFYDSFVLGFSNRVIWRCDSRELLALYQTNVSGCHLDVGVGTGYFLDRVVFPAARPAITLLDVNRACLAMTSRRLARYAPRIVEADVLDPLPLLGPFSSVGLCYLLHCVPGRISQKAMIFDHLKAVMAPAARIFGATIVQGASPRSWGARRLLDLYNATGILANTSDTIEDLERELTSRFRKVDVRLEGTVALFQAQRADEFR
jgi:hypothetical protein